MGIVLGLGAALAWGVADYFVAIAARRVGAHRVALGFHLIAVVPLGALALATGSLNGLTVHLCLSFVLLGAVGWLSYLAFYRALAIGPISLLSPVVSGYAAVTVLLSVIIAGARLSLLEAVAVGITIAGVGFACAEPSALRERRLDGDPPSRRRRDAAPWRTARGPIFAGAAMVLLGVYVFGLSYHDVGLGWVAPLFLARAFTMLFLLGHAGWRRDVRLRGLTARDGAMIASIACLDTLGFVSYRLGVLRAPTPLVATASAPYALVAVLLGVYVLRERLSGRQSTGLVVAGGGLVLLGLES